MERPVQAKIPKSERLLNLVALLLKSPEPVPIAGILDNVTGYAQEESGKSLDRKFERDKRDLIDLGIPVEYVEEDGWGRNGYRIRKEAYFLPPIRWDAGDLVALKRLRAAADDRDGRAHGDALRSALAKILTGGEPVPTASPAQVPLPHLPKEHDANVALLSEALFRRRGVAFRYRRPDQKRAAQRRLHPYAVVLHGPDWFVLGHDLGRREHRTFMIRRIDGKATWLSRGRGPDYAIPDDHEPTDHLMSHDWEYGDAETVVEVELDDVAAWLLGQERDLDVVRKLSGGGVRCRFRVWDLEVFYRWIAPRGSRARIAAPKRAVAGYRAFLGEIAGRHG